MSGACCGNVPQLHSEELGRFGGKAGATEELLCTFEDTRPELSDVSSVVKITNTALVELKELGEELGLLLDHYLEEAKELGPEFVVLADEVFVEVGVYFLMQATDGGEDPGQVC